MCQFVRGSRAVTCASAPPLRRTGGPAGAPRDLRGGAGQARDRDLRPGDDAANGGGAVRGGGGREGATGRVTGGNAPADDRPPPEASGIGRVGSPHTRDPQDSRRARTAPLEGKAIWTIFHSGRRLGPPPQTLSFAGPLPIKNWTIPRGATGNSGVRPLARAVSCRPLRADGREASRARPWMVARNVRWTGSSPEL